MSKRIITISREFGSGGRYIGEEVARRLGISYYDSKLIDEVSKNSGFDADYIAKHSELSPGKGLFSYAFVGRDFTGTSMEDYLYKIQKEVILNLAEKEPCVIIGRNADALLRDRDDVLNIFIYGNQDEKLSRIVDVYGHNPKEASKLMKEVDKRRAVHYNYYTDENWGMAKNYHISLNSSVIPYEKCMDIICSLYKEV